MRDSHAVWFVDLDSAKSANTIYAEKSQLDVLSPKLMVLLGRYQGLENAVVVNGDKFNKRLIP